MIKKFGIESNFLNQCQTPPFSRASLRLPAPDKGWSGSADPQGGTWSGQPGRRAARR